MSENTEAITRDMLIDKIDDELNSLHKGNNESAVLFAYRKASMGHIRDALYNTPIPDELLAIAYGREDILREAYLYWTEKASRGDEIIDKGDLALNCVRLWLEDVRGEYRYGLLYDRIAAEHDEFMAEERLKTPDEIIEDAWKITCYNDLLMTLANEEMDTRDIDALLTLRYPLANIYDEYLQRDMSDHMNDLLDTTLDIAQLQHDNIMDGYAMEHTQDTHSKQFVDEYLALYGAAGFDGEQGDAEPDMEP